MAGVAGIEPAVTVLETVGLPLTDTPPPNGPSITSFPCALYDTFR